MKISNKLYNFAKFVCLTVIPAIIVFVNAICPTIGVDDDVCKVITTSLSALATFIGTTLGISSANYQKTVEIVEKTEPIQNYTEENIESKTKVEFDGKYYEITGSETQILATRTWSDSEYDYYEYLYGDGQTSIKKSKVLTDEEKEAKYEKMVCKYPDKYPVSWAYDFDLTYQENLTIAKGEKTKEQILASR